MIHEQQIDWLNNLLPADAACDGEHAIDLQQFLQTETLLNSSYRDRLCGALHVLLELADTAPHVLDKLEPSLLDGMMCEIDHRLSTQLDDILHDPQWQALESHWRGLASLLAEADPQQNVYVDLLDVDKINLQDDFAECSDLSQSILHQQIYQQEYDMPGGEPYTAIISAFEFDASAPDLQLLKDLTSVAAKAHCPIIANVSPRFFKRESFADVLAIDDLPVFLDRADYINWQAFRESEAARYLGLCMPQLLARLPYGEQNPTRGFYYEERMQIDRWQNYCWMPASFAFAANIVKSFQEHGWCVNIRGPESGGKVQPVLLHQYDLGYGLQTKIPTQALIAESRELQFSECGFIPLSYYKNRDYACFFSANSAHKPPLFKHEAACANSRINARLPYVFLSSRLAHYLKVLQRETIGSNTTANELEQQLTTWLQTLVTKMNNPSAELAASHPLRDAYVKVEALADQPGVFQVDLFALPHFQIEGMDVKLSLVTQLPGKSQHLESLNN